MKQYELKWLRHGQQRPYGDSYYDCEIHTTEEMSDEEILAITKETGRLPYEQWKNHKTMDEYFRGYYTIEKTDYGYLYKGVYPYDD